MADHTQIDDSSKDSPAAKRIFFALDESLKKKQVYRSACMLVSTLKSAGFEALFVGGFVRKLVLPRRFEGTPAWDDGEMDIDIATSADPHAIRRLFRNAHFVGQIFGVSMVNHGHHSFEVASFRTEGPYSDGRRPDHVSLGTLFEDSCRRDFSINALYFDPDTSEVIDFHEGFADAKQLILRTVGNPADRFLEDRLRILRMCRFAANNGLEIETATWQAAKELAQGTASVSRERVILELKKTDVAALPKFLNYCSLLALDTLFWKIRCTPESELFRTVCKREKRFDFPVSFLLVAGWAFFLRLSPVERMTTVQSLVAWPTTVNDRKLLQNLLFLGESFQLINQETLLDHGARNFVHSAWILKLLRKVAALTFAEILSLVRTQRESDWELDPLHERLFSELVTQLMLVTRCKEQDEIAQSFRIFDQHKHSKGSEKKHLWRSQVISNLKRHKIKEKYFASLLIFADLVSLLPTNSYGQSIDALFLQLSDHSYQEFELDQIPCQHLEWFIGFEKMILQRLTGILHG